MDYFTKWVEAKPLAQIREADVIRFIYKNILSKFSIPRALFQIMGLNWARILQLNAELPVVQRASQGNQQDHHKRDQKEVTKIQR